MAIPLMALPMLAGLFGSDKTEVNTNVSLANALSINPNIAVTLGGDFGSLYDGFQDQDLDGTIQTHDEESGGGGFPFGGSSRSDLEYAGAGGASPSLFDNPLIMGGVLLGLAGLVILSVKKKKS